MRCFVYRLGATGWRRKMDSHWRLSLRSVYEAQWTMGMKMGRLTLVVLMLLLALLFWGAGQEGWHAEQRKRAEGWVGPAQRALRPRAAPLVSAVQGREECASGGEGSTAVRRGEGSSRAEVEGGCGRLCVLEPGCRFSAETPFSR
jgi:hypothetical protein